MELIPGGAAELQAELNHRHLLTYKTNMAQSARSAIATTMTFIQKALFWRLAAKPPREPDETGLPSYNSPAHVAEQPELADCDSSKLYLHLCIDEGSSKTTFFPRAIDHISRDRELFQYIRSQYLRLNPAKRWLTVRSMQRLALSQVRPHYVSLSSSPRIHQHKMLTQPSSSSITATRQTFANTSIYA